MSNADNPSRDYLHPALECDLVMKGGITSGVVYPPAVLGLAPTYRFRSIGGTSAGAIAAAATAAAEYGRESGGFGRLEQVSRQLAEPGMLLKLFQPSAETRPLMDSIFAVVESLKKAPGGRVPRLALDVTRALVKNTPAPFALGTAAGAALSLLLTFLTGGTINPGSLAVAAVAGWLGGSTASISKLGNLLFVALPQRSFFGLCSGRCDSAEPKTEVVLTDWLSATINELAGLDPQGPPLTFAQLATKEAAKGQPNIQLRLVTTNLSQGCPYVLPFEQNSFLFQESDMEMFFPPNIVKYLVDNAGVSDRLSLEQLPGFHWLPPGAALPVAVGMRLSLSFPLLISAVPLYTIKRSAFVDRPSGKSLVLAPDDLQMNLLSDGGICSNFPIHFFDAWLPVRPTFGINLVSRDKAAFIAGGQAGISTSYQSASALPVAPDESSAASGALGQSPAEASDTLGQLSDRQVSVRNVYLPRANAPLTPDWQGIDGIAGFISAVFGAAQNYRDTTQSMLPSYRDRIVNVYFKPEEGGLNLAMDTETIKNIQAKGMEAAQTILGDFNLEHHQWVRSIVLMHLIEEQLYNLRKDLTTIGIDHLFEEQLASQDSAQARFPYNRPKAWCDKALRRIHALVALIEAESNQPLTEQQPPKPEGVLRVTPEL